MQNQADYGSNHLRNLAYFTAMAGIFHDFFIGAPPARVFQSISTPTGLDKWWSKTSAGGGHVGNQLNLGFGPGFEWTAMVSKSVADASYEIVMDQSDSDWNGTIVGFHLEPAPGGTQVAFYHTGWPEENQHFRISSYCWAMLLRILKLNLEKGLEVPYEDRLKV